MHPKNAFMATNSMIFKVVVNFRNKKEISIILTNYSTILVVVDLLNSIIFDILFS